MQLTKPGYAIIYFILLCALTKRGSEGKRWNPVELNKDHGGFSSSLHLETNEADQVWEHWVKGNNGFSHRHLLDKSPQNQISPPSHASSSMSPKNSPTKKRGKAKPSSPPKTKKKPSHKVKSPPTPPSRPKNPPPTSKVNPAKLEKSQVKSIIIGATIAGIVMLLGLILCCCELKRSKKSNKDDKPLLGVSTSEMSGGSGSQDSNNLGNSDHQKSDMNNARNPSIGSKMSIKPEDNKASETKESEGKAQVSESDSKLSEGKPAPLAPPPPPPRAPRAPPPPRIVPKGPPAPPKPGNRSGTQNEHQRGTSDGGESDAPKAKLKPFFWDKVAANGDQAMVWHEIQSGSFQFSEEKIESLFGCAHQNKNERKKDSHSMEPAVQYIQIINPKKAQNLSILLRALNVTTQEVVGALTEGSEIPVELIQTLLKMAPTGDEELKLRLYTGEFSQLGPAERFLKVLVDTPFAFKRLEALLFMFTFPEEASSIRECFSTLEVSSHKLRESRLFLKLLEAVLKTGNRLNDGTYRGGAQAFKLDTLLKLSDVKGTDGKTTLLHFVVLEIIRSEGRRAVRTAKANQNPSSETVIEESQEHYRRLGIEVVSGLSTELEDVRKAAVMDGEALTSAVLKLDQAYRKIEAFMNGDLKRLEEDSKFQQSLESFMEKAKDELSWLMEEEKRIMAHVKNTADYFHGKAGKDEGLRLFVIVRDFLVMLDKVCKEVKATTEAALKEASKKEHRNSVSSPRNSVSSPRDSTHQRTPSYVHRRVFPAIAERRERYSYDDDDDEDDDDDFSSPT